jgi:hypothetical protein
MGVGIILFIFRRGDRRLLPRLALLSDAGHMLSDIGAGVKLFAFHGAPAGRIGAPTATSL